jgi:nucleotide-binding universal stress UspA family protein
MIRAAGQILIPTDGSDLSDEAIQYGTALAKAVNAKVTGVTVSAPFLSLRLSLRRSQTRSNHIGNG